jgi:glycosyltransferase involved in cell wall biosynthesis
MKLLIYSHFFAPSVGGVESVVLSLAQGLSEFHGENAEAFEITLVTQAAKGDFDDQSLPFPVVRRPGLFRLWKLIRQTDLLHVAGPAIAPLLLAILARKPVVVEHHGYQVACPNGLLFHHPTQRPCPGHFKLHNYLECLRCNWRNEGLWNSVRLLALTSVREALCRRVALNLAPTAHVAARNMLRNSSVIFHGTEGQAADIQFTSADLKHSFAYVGRLVKEKGVIVLLHAARILLNENRCFSVKLIGDGPERVEIEKQIETLGLQKVVICTGLLLGDTLFNALADVGTIVMPTIMEETAGMAAIEQMARGRLVIASDIGGLAEVVGDAGLKFNPGDAPALAARMRQVLQDASLLDVLGDKARERARRYFSRESMIANHAQAYFDVLARSA